jgi:hypothetical protein
MEGEHLRDLVIRGRIILKWILRYEMGIGLKWLRIGSNGGDLKKKDYTETSGVELVGCII